jgi:hypothetical protein
MIRQLIIQVTQWFSLFKLVERLDDYSNAFGNELKSLAEQKGDEIIIDYDQWVDFNKKWSIYQELGQWLDSLKTKAREHMKTRPSQLSQPSVSRMELTIEQVILLFSF